MQNEKNNVINITEIVKDGNLAKISHAIAGVLYYEVSTAAGNKYMFPVDMNDREDVGTATFPAELKAITLMRYIRKAMQTDSLIKIK